MPNEPRIRETYKGFDIVNKYKLYGSNYLTIYKEGEQLTNMALNSIKACKNVIDTHVQAQKEKQYLENFIQEHKKKHT